MRVLHISIVLFWFIDIVLFKISVSTVIRGARGKILDNSALPI